MEPAQGIEADALAAACRVLQNWNGVAEADARGALLWEAFWAELETREGEQLYRVPFSPERPLDTPAEPAPDGARIRQALLAAVKKLSAEGIGLDAPYGEFRYIESGGRRWPLYGGCNDDGKFTINCPEEGQYALGPQTISNSYLQVVSFSAAGTDAGVSTRDKDGAGRRGAMNASGAMTVPDAGAASRVQAYTLLAHGQDELAVTNGPGSAPVSRYARKNWLRFPFSEAEIRQDPHLRRTVLTGDYLRASPASK